MKKLLALFLACILCLGLCVPALAAEGTFYVDGEPVGPYPADALESGTPPMLLYPLPEEEEDADLAAEYEAAHPEEIAGLDVDALIAGWGYEDINMTAREQFMEVYGGDNDTAEETAKRVYIDNRLLVQEYCQTAEEYRAEYPEEWESFDAYTFFDEHVREDYHPWTDVATYMADYNILTEDEFVDDMFVWYIDAYAGEDDEGDDLSDVIWGEPTLTLTVNGEASEAAVTAENGVAYVDAADLRAILGQTAVAADVTGPVAVRAAAEAAGWDVVWYDGGWRGMDQEVCLWDKAAYTAELDKTFAPLRAIYTRLMDKSQELWQDKEGIAETETVDLTLTRFNTLDGNKTYTAKITAQTILQAGVADITVTFDVSDLLRIFTAQELKALTAEADFTPESLAALLKGGKIELLMDMNTGSVAVNAPILGLIDPELAGWHAMTVSDFGLEAVKDMTQFDELAGTPYDELLDSAGRSGAFEAQMDYTNNLAVFNAFFGPDTLQVKDDGSMTFTLTTQRVNAICGELMAASIPGYYDATGGESISFFKNYDLTMTVDADWNVSMDMEMRFDADGIAALAIAEDSGADAALGSVVIRVLMGLVDVRVTAHAEGDLEQSKGAMEFHWKNQGALKMESKSSAAKAGTAPRKPSDVVAPEDFFDPMAGMGIIGGADGPTAIFTAG